MTGCANVLIVDYFTLSWLLDQESGKLCRFLHLHAQVLELLPQLIYGDLCIGLISFLAKQERHHILWNKLTLLEKQFDQSDGLGQLLRLD